MGNYTVIIALYFPVSVFFQNMLPSLFVDLTRDFVPRDASPPDDLVIVIVIVIVVVIVNVFSFWIFFKNGIIFELFSS